MEEIMQQILEGQKKILEAIESHNEVCKAYKKIEDPAISFREVHTNYVYEQKHFEANYKELVDVIGITDYMIKQSPTNKAIGRLQVQIDMYNDGSDTAQKMLLNGIKELIKTGKANILKEEHA